MRHPGCGWQDPGTHPSTSDGWLRCWVQGGRHSCHRPACCPAHPLNPLASPSFTPPSLHRGAIRDIPAAHRHLLVDRLPSSGIAKLWKLAGQRFRAAQSQAAAAMGPDASLWADMPSRLSQLSLFKGRAALPTDLLGVSWFTQVGWGGCAPAG